MAVNDAIGLLENKLKRKVIQYAIIDDTFFFVVDCDPRLFQNPFYLVHQDGRIEVTIPELVDFKNLNLINV